MKKSAKKNALQVCLLSPHPLVLSEFERVLANPAFKTDFASIWNRRWGRICGICRFPRPLVYVVDAHVARPAAGALLSNILDNHTEARIIVVAEKFDSDGKLFAAADGRQGIAQLHRGPRTTAPRAALGGRTAGSGFPRAVLSGFVDSILGGTHSRRLKADAAADLSRREQEVLNSPARKSGQQRNRKQTQYFRANRKVSRFQPAE